MRLQAEGRLDTVGVSVVGQGQGQGRLLQRAGSSGWPGRATCPGLRAELTPSAWWARERKAALAAGPWAWPPCQHALPGQAVTLQGQVLKGARVHGTGLSQPHASREDKEGQRRDPEPCPGKAAPQVSTLQLHKQQGEVTGTQSAERAICQPESTQSPGRGHCRTPPRL